MSFAAGVFCILYSVLYVVSFMWFSGPTPSKGPPPPSPAPPSLPHRDKVNSLRPCRGGRGIVGGLYLVPPSAPSPFVQNKLEINSNMKYASGTWKVVLDTKNQDPSPLSKRKGFNVHLITMTGSRQKLSVTFPVGCLLSTFSAAFSRPCFGVILVSNYGHWAIQ